MADKRRTTDPPRTRRLIALVPLLWAAGCGSPGSQQRVVTVWAMGREGEVVGDLLPQFARAHPDIVVRVQQLPWYAAHEKLLTAFAGDATPDVCLLGNTWIPEFVALKALEPLDEPLAHSGVVRREDYFPGIWDTNVVGGALYGVPWYVDTRLLFYRRDLLARAGFPEPPKTWQEWARARCHQGAGGTRALQRAVAAQRVRAVDGARPAAGRPAAARRRPLRQLRESRIPPGIRLLSRDVPPPMGAAGREHPDLQRLGGARPRLLLVLYQRAVEHRRVQAPSAVRATGELDDGAHAGARGPRRLGGERREPRHLPPLAPQGRRLATGRVPVRSRGAKALLRVDRRPAPAPQHLERADARRERLCAGLPRAARAGQAHAEGRRMGAHHDHDAAHGRARRARRRAGRGGPAAARPRRRRHAAEAPLAARARPDPVSARHAAWLFAAPALAVIGVFFFLPVLAALFVSLTDFDLYPLADIRNLRFVGLGNYWRLLQATET